MTLRDFIAQAKEPPPKLTLAVLQKAMQDVLKQGTVRTFRVR